MNIVRTKTGELIHATQIKEDEVYFCPECGEEMKREIDSMVCRSIDKTGDFYRSFN